MDRPQGKQHVTICVVRSQTLACAAVTGPLEGTGAGTALMGPNSVNMASMSGTHKQWTEDKLTPAEKQQTCLRSMHICHLNICLIQEKYSCFVVLKHLYLSRIVQSLHNAFILTPDTRQSHSCMWSCPLSMVQNEARSSPVETACGMCIGPAAHISCT